MSKKKHLPSDTITYGLGCAPQRTLLHATGLPRSEMKKPFIGIATSFTDLIPGHIGMRDLERFIEKGVHTGGGWSFLFGIPGICDGIAMGHKGMHYSLASRELIADMIETMAEANRLDGLILLTNCDKITPGMLMGAARVNIPSIVVTAGPMMAGHLKGERLNLVDGAFKSVGRKKRGEITAKDVAELEMNACPGSGSCQGMYTANTMSCVTEALGMSLPGCATSLAVSSKKRMIAFESGARIVSLVKEGVRPRDIMSRAAFENAIMVDMTLGGSTNTVLHIPAIAHEAEISLSLELFNKISKKTPHTTSMIPGGDHYLEDLEKAGGIPAVLKRLRTRLNQAQTVSHKNILEIARNAKIVDPEVIRPIKKAHHKEGGIAVLKGNLAPDGCVVKQTAVSKNMMKHRGRARVFNSEEAAMKAILGGKIKSGDVIVIRYEGPKGGPGMREMLNPTSTIASIGLSSSVALITDGRFSGGTEGPCIGHISPEAAEGGPIALIKEGDLISLDIPKRRLTLEITSEEMRDRRNKLKLIKPKIKKGWLARYAVLVTSASTGAVMKTP